jgi:hypothetical protein
VPLVAAPEAIAQVGAAVTHAAHAPTMIGRKGAGAAQRSSKSAGVDTSKSAANMAAAEAAPHVATAAAEAASHVAAAAAAASHMAAATSAAMATSATATPARQGIG